MTSIAATVETVAGAAGADTAFAPGAPSLPVAEPSLLLLALASGTPGRAIGNADTSHPGLRCGSVPGGVERHRRRPGAVCVRAPLDARRWPGSASRYAGPSCENLIINDDLVLGLLQLHQLAELGGLTRLALADHLSRGPEQADNPALAVAVTVKDACPRLPYDLLNPRSISSSN